MSKKFHKQISSLLSTIVANYQEHPDMIPLDSGSLPNKDVIIEIIHMLREVLFPGYFGKQNLITATLEYHIGDLLIDIHEKLHKQIGYALKHQAIKTSDVTIAIDKKADEIVCEFLSKIPKIRDILATDVQAAFDGDPAAEDKDEIIFSYPGIFAVSIHRLAHELYLLSVPLIPRIMTEYAHSVTGIDIHAGAEIGKHFFIDHGTGVVIGETTTIGDHVKMYQGVTLGALSTKGGQNLRGAKRHPTLEDEVTVYSGASILGGETVIGKGVVIGSNAFITQSVADGTKVSVRNPELLFKGHAPQEFIPDWVI
jgi:serine O-acetyltransferase